MEVTTLQIALAVAAASGVGFWFGWWSKHRQQSTQRAMLDELWTRKLKSYERALEEAQAAQIQTSTRVQSSAREIAAAQALAREAEVHAETLGRRIGELEAGVLERERRADELERSRERIGRELVLARRELSATRGSLEERERRLGALDRLPEQLLEREGELARLERKLREDRESQGAEIARLQEWVDDLAHLPGVLERREAELRESQERLGRVEAAAADEAQRLATALGERERVQRKLEGRLRRLREDHERERARALRARDELDALREQTRASAARHLELERELAARDQVLAATFERERALAAERSREYERSTADLGREYERTLAERCDEYERLIAAREDQHASAAATALEREWDGLERTAAEYEAVLVDLHRAHHARVEQVESGARAGLGAAESSAAAERRELLRAAEEALAQARLEAGEELERERLAAREALEVERRAAREALVEERARALEAERSAGEARELELVLDLERCALEYEATLAEVFRAGAVGSVVASDEAVEVPTPPERSEPEEESPPAVGASSLDVEAVDGGSVPASAPPCEVPDGLAALLAAPLLELEAAATAFELARARELSAALAPLRAVLDPARVPEAEVAPETPAPTVSDGRSAARRMRARPPRASLARAGSTDAAGALPGVPAESDLPGEIPSAGGVPSGAEVEPPDPVLCGTPAEPPRSAAAELHAAPEPPTTASPPQPERAVVIRDAAQPETETETVLEPAPPRRRRPVPPSLPRPLRARASKTPVEREEPPATGEAAAPEALRQEELVPQAPPPGGAHRSSPRDELMRVRGIGPTLADRLVAVGCDSLRELASVGEARVEELARELRIPPARIRRERWIELARALLAGESPT